MGAAVSAFNWCHWCQLFLRQTIVYILLEAVFVLYVFAVEWSHKANFRPVSGEIIIQDLRCLEYEIVGLTRGTPYYVRVTAWGPKGFGKHAYSQPPCATPSSE